MTYFSQFGEDRILAEIFPRNDGLCVEVGANDGEYGSTTLYFEQQGWDCVLVEPNPDLCEILRQRRPRARLFECGAADHAGTATLNIAEGAAHADGVSSIGDPEASAARISTFGFDSRPVEIAIRTLDAILADAAIDRPIDFISVDVEGMELAVLRGCALSRWNPRILIIEDNSNFRDRNVRDHLAAEGYVPFRRTGVNDWYARAGDPLITDRSTADYAAAERRTRLTARLRPLKHSVAKIPGALRLWHVVRRWMQ